MNWSKDDCLMIVAGVVLKVFLNTTERKNRPAYGWSLMLWPVGNGPRDVSSFDLACSVTQQTCYNTRAFKAFSLIPERLYG